MEPYASSGYALSLLGLGLILGLLNIRHAATNREQLMDVTKDFKTFQASFMGERYALLGPKQHDNEAGHHCYLVENFPQSHGSCFTSHLSPSCGAARRFWLLQRISSCTSKPTHFLLCRFYLRMYGPLAHSCDAASIRSVSMAVPSARVVPLQQY